MDRRSYLGALAATGVAGAAGCLETLSGDDSATVLSPPDSDDPRARGDFSHPVHGDEFPDFSIPDPLTDEEVSLADVTGDRAFLMTFIFTSCTDECGTLVRMLQLVQEDAAERGYEDDIALLAMTFDPETDDAEALQEYGERHDVDLEAGNWHFLRPDTEEEALALVNEQHPDGFGSPVEVRAPEEGEHDHHHDDGDHHHDDDRDDGDHHHDDGDHHHDDDHDDGDHHHDDIDGETTTHYYMIFLVNEDGITERSYPNAASRRPKEIIDDTRSVVE